MRDDELRALERAVRESPDDPAAWARYVRALNAASWQPTGAEEDSFLRYLHAVQHGGPISADDLWSGRVRRVLACLREAPEKAPWPALIDLGDEVWVEEGDAPKIVGRWRGRVVGIDLPNRSHHGRLPPPRPNFHVRPLALDEDPSEIAWRTSPRPEWLSRGLLVQPPEDMIELIARGPSTPHPPAR